MGQIDTSVVLARPGVLTSGHFLLRSGWHSDAYLDKYAIYADRSATYDSAKLVAQEFATERLRTVVGPWLGGKIWADWISDTLAFATGSKVESVAARKIGGGEFLIEESDRKYVKGKNVLIAEDVLTTGCTAMNVVSAVRNAGGVVTGLAVLANRSPVGRTDFAEVPKFFAVMSVSLGAWSPEECGPCDRGIPMVEVV